MRLLLDTHALLWFALADTRLSSHAKELIEDPHDELHFSAASIWEMAIKARLGRLELGEPLGVFVTRQLDLIGIRLLPIEPSHIFRTVELPLHHRDPFDRMLAAQCLCEAMRVVSTDSVFDAYGVRRDW